MAAGINGGLYMTFWAEVLAIFAGDMFASIVLVGLYGLIQWFLRATDVTIGYNWKWRDQDFWPSFDIRNYSGSKTYRLANIAYTKNKGKDIIPFDNESLWGKEMKPGSIEFLDGNPVPNVNSVQDCMQVEVGVRLQNGRQFWLKGQGPGQLHMGRVAASRILVAPEIWRRPQYR